MNTERLLRTAQLVRNIDANKFNMNKWREESPCGTVGCAVGHAAMDPWFNNQGLHIKELVLGYQPIYEGRYSYEAVAKFYEISGLEAEFLFMPSKYVDAMREAYSGKDLLKWEITQSMVADRIEKFVADNTPLVVPNFESIVDTELVPV